MPALLPTPTGLDHQPSTQPRNSTKPCNLPTSFTAGGSGENKRHWPFSESLISLAILAIVAWLIADNRLWERSRIRRLRPLSALYNTAMVTTIVCGVLVTLLVLYAMLFVAAIVVIPSNYLVSTAPRRHL